MKKRDFFGYATVTDYLIAHGVKFDSRSIIMEVDTINDDPDTFSYEQLISGIVRPVFNIQIVEQILQVANIPKLGRLQYIVYSPDTNAVFITVYNVSTVIGIGETTIKFNLEPDGTIDRTQPGEMLMNPRSLVPPNAVEGIPHNDIMEDAIFALAVFGTIHTGYEIEEVEFPRNYRRKIERDTGKRPSNHYRIRHIKRSRKRYQPSGKGTSTKKSQHLVRGHFRHVENHTIQQFNGDFWIPAHYRGGDKDSTKPKSKPVYRIQL